VASGPEFDESGVVELSFEKGVRKMATATASAQTGAQTGAQAQPKATTYGEARAIFDAWHPKTLQRQGANGMVFDYLPVQTYENFLDAVVGPENWHTQVSLGENAVAVTLTIFGVSKSRSSTIQVGKGKGESNEAEKAEARAFRRAAGSHGILRYLWEKGQPEERATGARNGATAQGMKRESTSGQRAVTRSVAPTNGNRPTEKQRNLLADLGVPAAIIDQLSPGREGTASGMITALLTAKREHDDYEDEPEEYVEQALRDMGLEKLVVLLDEESDEEDDEFDED
jgi:hypothetical protein